MTDEKSDIEKYKNGELTPAEMHALEKRALSDPFLAEALEGVENISSEELSADLRELEKKIQSKKQAVFDSDQSAGMPVTKGQPNKWVWRIAASVLIIAGTFWLANLLLPKRGQENLALKKETPQEAPKQAPAINSFSDTIKKADAFKLSGEPGKSSRIQNKPSVVSPTASDAGAKASSTPTESKEADLREEATIEPVAAEKQSELALKESPKVATADVPAAVSEDRAKMKAAATRQPFSIVKNTIQGQVRSAEDDTPIPGVTILIKGDQQGAITDDKGNFQLPPVAPNQKLVFSFVGYVAQEVVPVAGQPLDIKLTPDISQLSEVVVTASRDRKEDESPVIKLAEPIGGRKAYDKYLETDLHYPIAALEKKIKGRVLLQFTVKADGELTDFNIKKGLGFGCDEEVVRLVKEGPAWSPTTEDNVPVESWVLIKVRFDPAKAGN